MSYSNCRLCPRMCDVDRRSGKRGYCGETSALRLARAALHMWEEPCISGEEGSGTVFFSGCSMKCIYCQNHSIALGNKGKEVSTERLTEIFFELESQGANNINLVTPTHFVPHIRTAVADAKSRGIRIPFVYNTSSYENAETLRSLEGLIDIYIPDFKYYDSDTAGELSRAEDYPTVAKAAIAEMVRQCPTPRYDSRGMMQSGVIVRHMLLPRHVYEAKKIIKYIFENYGNSVVYSLMSQYTPMKSFEQFPWLGRRVSQREYDSFVDFCLELGVENAYIQEGEAASESFIPDFDTSGV